MKYVARVKVRDVVVSKEVSREEAFAIIQPSPQVTVDCYDDQGYYGSFGCVFVTQVETNHRLDFKTINKGERI